MVLINTDIVVMVLELKNVFFLNFHGQMVAGVKMLYYNWSSCFVFVDAVKMYQFKTKDSEIKPYLFYISKAFTINNMRKARLKEYVKVFPLDCNIDTNGIFNIHKYLMKMIIERLHNNSYAAQKMKFSIKDFFSKCDQIRSFLRIWSHLLKKSLTENFLFLCHEFWWIISLKL